MEVESRFGGTRRIAAGVALGIIPGLVLGGAHWKNENFDIDGDVTTTAPPTAIITEVYDIEPKTCDVGGYDTLVADSKARFDLTATIGGKPKTVGINTLESYSGVQTSQLCTSESPGKKTVSYNPRTNQAKVTYWPNAFSVVTFPKDLTDPNAFAPSKDSFAMAHLDVLGLIINSNDAIKDRVSTLKLPFGNGDDLSKFATRVHNKTRGAAQRQASQIAAEICGPLALRLLEDKYEQRVKKETRGQLDNFRVKVPDDAEIEVEFPNNPRITDQYGSREDLAESDITLDADGLTKTNCQISKAVRQPS